MPLIVAATTPAGNPLARKIHRLSARARGQPELRGHLRSNPAKLVPLRRVARSSIEALTEDRAAEILKALAGDRLEAACALAFMGLRSSEILGIARSDLDLDAMTLSIRHQIAGSGRRATLVATKTAASVGAIPLPPFVVVRLRTHLDRQRAERPVVPIDDALVFVTESGLAINGSWFTKHFQLLLRRAGLPTMRLHDMRHGAVSLLIGAGAHQEGCRHDRSSERAGAARRSYAGGYVASIAYEVLNEIAHFGSTALWHPFVISDDEERRIAFSTAPGWRKPDDARTVWRCSRSPMMRPLRPCGATQPTT